MPSPEKTRIAVIGNSHAASIKSAWDELAESHPQYELVFFCSRSDTAAQVKREGNKLVPKSEWLGERFAFTSGGLTEIDLDQYDEVLIYGMRAVPFYIGNDEFYSRAATRAALQDATRPKAYFKLVKMLADDSGKPIHIGHEPLHARKVKEKTDQATDRYHQELGDINSHFLEPLGARMWPQPEETIVNGANTELEYSQGSTKLEAGYRIDGGEHSAVDRHHMNKDFGVLWLKQFFDGR